MVEGYGATAEREWLSGLSDVASSRPSPSVVPWVAVSGGNDDAHVVVGLNLDDSSSLIAVFDVATFLLGGSENAAHHVMAMLGPPPESDASRADMHDGGRAYIGPAGGDATTASDREAMMASTDAQHSHGESVMHEQRDKSRFVSSITVDVFGEPWALNVHTTGGFLEPQRATSR